VLRLLVVELVDVGGERDDELGVGDGQLLGEFGGGVGGVGGGGDGAEHGDRHEGEDELRGVGEENHDGVALLDAQLRHAGGHLPRGAVSVGVGVGSGGGDEACAVGDFGKFKEAVFVEEEVVGEWNVW